MWKTSLWTLCNVSRVFKPTVTVARLQSGTLSIMMISYLYQRCSKDKESVCGPDEEAGAEEAGPHLSELSFCV